MLPSVNREPKLLRISNSIVIHLCSETIRVKSPPWYNKIVTLIELELLKNDVWTIPISLLYQEKKTKQF